MKPRDLPPDLLQAIHSSLDNALADPRNGTSMICGPAMPDLAVLVVRQPHAADLVDMFQIIARQLANPKNVERTIERLQIPDPPQQPPPPERN